MSPFATPWTSAPTLLWPNVEPAVNRQPGFRRELVEQSMHLIISFMISFSESYSTSKLLNSLFYIKKKCEHTPGFKTQVWISTEADTRGKLNFNMI